MKLKFKIIKNGLEAFSKEVENTSDGDAWVNEFKSTFGKQDQSLNIEQVQSLGLKIEDATSSSDEPVLSLGNPVLDENGQPVTQKIYHFAKDWHVEVEDITTVVEHQKKKFSKKEIRLMCNDLIDEISIENEGKDAAHMDAIFMNPSFVSLGVALLVGAPETAKRQVQLLGPSLYSQEKVAEIVSKLDAIIASKGG